MSDLYIKSSDLKLSYSGQKVVINTLDGEIVRELAIGLIDNVLIFGTCQLSTQLVRQLAYHKVNVYYFSQEGHFLSSVDSYREEDYEKQELQVKAYFDGDFRLAVAKRIAKGKVKHQVALLASFDDNHLLDNKDYQPFQKGNQTIDEASSISEIMGIEGRLAKSYFYYLSLLLPEDFQFKGRSRRPARDAFNSALNFGYSILYSCFIGLIKKNGLSLGFGLIHEHHRHHATLASDLMEEWRPIIVDNTVVQLMRQGHLVAEHFEENEDTGVFITSQGREIFLRAFRSRMCEVHPYIEGDPKRYDFLYTADHHIKSLIKAYEHVDPSLFETVDTGGH